jgi:hypothetical protein
VNCGSIVAEIGRFADDPGQYDGTHLTGVHPWQAADVRPPSPLQPATPAAAWGDVPNYVQDCVQRSFLFLDTLLDRGNDYLEHLEQGTPPLLKFDHELVLDGHDLPEPCNYALLRLQPPPGLPVDAQARPVVVVDPRAGHGPALVASSSIRKWAWR